MSTRLGSRRAVLKRHSNLPGKARSVSHRRSGERAPALVCFAPPAAYRVPPDTKFLFRSIPGYTSAMLAKIEL